MRIRVTVRLPKKPFSASPYLTELERAMRLEAANKIKALAKQTVEGWDNPPDFIQRYAINFKSISVTVIPTGSGAEIYSLVSRGSPAHIIKPRNVGFLRFQPGYTPATTVGSLQSRSKSRFGGYVKASLVHHPGFEPRDFPKLIKEAYQDEFKTDMQDTINRVAKS